MLDLDISEFFDEDGPLATALPGYKPRPAQVELSQAIGQAIQDRATLVAEAGTGTDAALAALTEALSRAAQARAALAADYPDEGLADMPLDALDLQWREAQGKSWPFAGMAQKKLRRILQSYARSGEPDPASDLPALRQLQRARRDIDGSDLRGVPGFAQERSDPARIRQELEAAQGFLGLERHLRAAGLPSPSSWTAAPCAWACPPISTRPSSEAAARVPRPRPALPQAPGRPTTTAPWPRRSPAPWPRGRSRTAPRWPRVTRSRSWRR